MNPTERGIAHYLGEERLKFLHNVRVGMAGCGGLGSNCAMHLVRSGFKQFVLADLDDVEPSNLNRQAFTMEQIGLAKVEALAANIWAVNPDCTLQSHNTEVTPGNINRLFDSCDVVVEAFDLPQAKKLVVESMVPAGKLVVSASGLGGVGNSDAMVIRKLRENFYLVGDGESECTIDMPPMSPRVNIAAAKQADIVLEYFLERFQAVNGD